MAFKKVRQRTSQMDSPMLSILHYKQVKWRDRAIPFFSPHLVLLKLQQRSCQRDKPKYDIRHPMWCFLSARAIKSICCRSKWNQKRQLKCFSFHYFEVLASTFQQRRTTETVMSFGSSSSLYPHPGRSFQPGEMSTTNWPRVEDKCDGDATTSRSSRKEICLLERFLNFNYRLSRVEGISACGTLCSSDSQTFSLFGKAPAQLLRQGVWRCISKQDWTSSTFRKNRGATAENLCFTAMNFWLSDSHEYRRSFYAFFINPRGEKMCLGGLMMISARINKSRRVRSTSKKPFTVHDHITDARILHPTRALLICKLA